MTPQVYFVDGQEVAAKPYHYRECGLESVYLLNGFHVETVCGEEAIRIQNMDGLWKAIALHLVSERKILSPREVRFLRNQMRLTQADLARLLRVTDQTVARWEKGETELPGPADVALRATYLACPAAQPQGERILDKLIELLTDLSGTDEPSMPNVTFRLDATTEGWLEQDMAA